VLPSFIYYRTGINPNEQDVRDRQLFMMALYMVLFLQFNYQQRNQLINSCFNDNDEYSELMLWVCKWSNYALNGRGDEAK
jgi:hypothetical protein